MPSAVQLVSPASSQRGAGATQFQDLHSSDDSLLDEPPEGSFDRPSCDARPTVRYLPRSNRPDSPNLAGQYASVIYKQLRDVQSGARVNAIMSPFATPLGDQDMLNLAAYYSYLPRLPAYHPSQALPAPSIVVYGAPLRGIAPCGSCNGGLENKQESSWLEDQSAVYIKSQLQAFATDSRRNDISQQMRNIARHLTFEEIEAAANYYASQPPEFQGTSR